MVCMGELKDRFFEKLGEAGEIASAARAVGVLEQTARRWALEDKERVR